MEKNAHLNAVIFIAVWYFHKSFPTAVRWQKVRVTCLSLTEGRTEKAGWGLQWWRKWARPMRKWHSAVMGANQSIQSRNAEPCLPSFSTIDMLVESVVAFMLWDDSALLAVRESRGLCRAYPGDWSSQDGGLGQGLASVSPWPAGSFFALQSSQVHNKHISLWSPFEYKTFFFFYPRDSTNFVNLRNSLKFYDFILL